jgi:cell wall-associated NlpC family hydrolase
MSTPRHAVPFLVLGAALVVVSACASNTPRVRVLPPNTAPGVEKTAPPETVERPSAAGNAAGEAIARTAETLLGAPYREGGSLPDGFDCSGLVTYVFARHGIAVPRDVRSLVSAGVAIDRGDIVPGDLVFFATAGSGPTHVGIVTGGGRFIHAPKSGDVVRTESMSASYWTSRFVAARRIAAQR